MRIAFLDFLPWDYGVDSVWDQPLGGAQSAACYLAMALARRGQEVFYISNTSRPGIRHDVHGVAWSEATDAHLRGLRLDALVLLPGAGRGRQFKAVVGPKTKLILWTGMVHNLPSVAALSDAAERDAYDGIALLSRWQREKFVTQFGLDPRKTVVLANAIAPAFAGLFAEGESILAAKEQPPVLAYASAPYRGMEVLLDVFDGIRRKVPGTQLQVYSSMQLYRTDQLEEHTRFGALYERARGMAGVQYVGALPQRELAGRLRRASMLAYPNVYAETSSIAVMEAMAAGCAIVSSEFGALPETTAGFAHLLPVGTESERHAFGRKFIRETVRVLRELAGDKRTTWEQHLQKQVAWVNANCTWEKRAAEWIAWLSG